MKNLRIIYHTVKVLEYLLALGVMLNIAFTVTNFFGWTNINWWLVFTPTMILIGFPIVTWCVGFVVLLRRNLVDWYLFYSMKRQLRERKKEQEKIERELDALRRKV